MQRNRILWPFSAIVIEMRTRTRGRRAKGFSTKLPRYTRNASPVSLIRNRKEKSRICEYSKFHNVNKACKLLQKFTTSFCRLAHSMPSAGFSTNFQTSAIQHKHERQNIKSVKKKSSVWAAQEAAAERKLALKNERLARERNGKKPKK
jgi:hypothetical protein